MLRFLLVIVLALMSAYVAVPLMRSLRWDYGLFNRVTDGAIVAGVTFLVGTLLGIVLLRADLLGIAVIALVTAAVSIAFVSAARGEEKLYEEGTDK